MHLHSHHFQRSGIGDQAFEGALRDTVMVGPRLSVRIAFDARNPGEWPPHCHTSPITLKPG
jgi:FtsP/CotA-like multicopper oxidase with cupredoxin domain